MYLSTGPHLSHGWLFQEHKATLGFSVCTTLTEMFCSISSSTSSAPQQQPEQKETLVKYMLTLGRRNIFITNGQLSHLGKMQWNHFQEMWVTPWRSGFYTLLGQKVWQCWWPQQRRDTSVRWNTKKIGCTAILPQMASCRTFPTSEVRLCRIIWRSSTSTRSVVREPVMFKVNVMMCVHSMGP